MKRFAVGAVFAASVLSLAACKEDNRTALEAFQNCNSTMKLADDEDEVLVCFTDAARQEIQDERYGDIEPRLEMFRSERPDAPRLFREVEAEGKTHLLIIEEDGPDYARHVVQMVRTSGEWRIAQWDSLLMGLRDDPEAPIEVALDFEGAVEWTSDDPVISIGAVPRCSISISHVFDVANVNFPAKCDLLRKPGDYRADEFLDPAAERPIYVSVKGSPNRPDIGVDRSEDAVPAVPEAPDGKISGTFAIEIAHPDGGYTVSGAFENVPFDDGTGQ